MILILKNDLQQEENKSLKEDVRDAQLALKEKFR